MVIEAGLALYVVALLVGLSLGRPPAAATVAAATAVAVGATHLVTPTWAPGWPTPGGDEWWPAAYTAGWTAFGAGHHDVHAVSLVCLVGAALALGGFNCSGWNAHEYVALLFLVVVAAFTTLVTDHLAVLYLTLELQALTVYTLVGYYRVRVLTTEAALKYLLVGSAVSGFMLVGLFGVYSGSGTFNVGELRFDLTEGATWLVGAVLFKVGAAPFHFWAPAVYESVEWPTLVGLVSFAKLNVWVLLWGVLDPVVQAGWWQTLLAGGASLVVGAVGGLYQTSVGGVLGYSAALNSGYLLVVGSSGAAGVGFSLYLYVLTYSAGAAALGVALAYGVGNRPFALGLTGVATAVVVYYLMLNLGGLPVYPGFATKLYLLWAAAPVGVALGVAIVGFSVFAFFYFWEVRGFLLFDVSPPLVNTAPPRRVGVGAALFGAAAVGGVFVGQLTLTPAM